jgi:flagellar basal body-associated protein FliL
MKSKEGVFKVGKSAILLIVVTGFILSITISTTIMAFATSLPGAQVTINQTGQFVSNVSETIAENPITTNITGETQEYFADKSK